MNKLSVLLFVGIVVNCMQGMEHDAESMELDNDSASLNITNHSTGDTPLHIACRERDFDAIERLLSSLDDEQLEIANDEGKTAFEITDEDGNTILHNIFKFKQGRLFLKIHGKMINSRYFDITNNKGEIPVDTTDQDGKVFISYILNMIREGKEEQLFHTEGSPR